MGFGRKKEPKDDPMGNGHVTVEQMRDMMGDFMQKAVEISTRAADERMQQWMAKNGGVKVLGGMGAEEAKELRPLLFTPKRERMREMTIFNAKECALQPWLWTLEESLHAGRRHGSLLGHYLLAKEQCNRSLDGHFLDNTVTMASMDVQKESWSDSHASG